MTTTNEDLYVPKEPTHDDIILSVKMPRSLRDQFAKLCQSKNTDMAKVIRRFLEREVNNQLTTKNVTEES